MRSLLAPLLRRRAGARDDGQVPAGDSVAVREAIIEDGLTVERALALGDALEAEGQFLDAVEALTTANRLRRDVGVERRLVRLRHRSFEQVDRSLSSPPWPPEVPELSAGPEGPPVVPAAELTPAVLRYGILRHGCVLVRGLIRPSRAARLRDAIDRAFDAADATVEGRATPAMAAWYDPFESLPRAEETRPWVRKGGGVLAADSPRAFFEFLETMYELGVDRLIAAYLEERPTLSVEKCVLRKTEPAAFLANWHQDGAFLGAGIRTVDAWFALSPCGKDSPEMEIIPRRLERVLPTGSGASAAFSWTVSAETVLQEIPDARVWRPEFEAGDALLFDHLCLHRTGAYPEMTRLRYAIESWWFASSVYPEGSTPLVI